MKKTYIALAVLAALSLAFAACQTPAAVAAAPAAPAKAAKLCALTFDDGPDAVLTPLVLDKLEKYGVPATFMLVGQLVNDGTGPVLARAKKDGCEFGNHSWEWKSMNDLSPAEIEDSVAKTSAAIEKYTGTPPKFFRPPNLAVGPVMYANIDLPFVEGVLGFDWAGTGTDAKQRADNVLKEMRDGAIILLHDVQPLPHPTPEALDILIPALKAQGYEFVTLSELFKRKGVDPASAEGRMWKYVE